MQLRALTGLPTGARPAAGLFMRSPRVHGLPARFTTRRLRTTTIRAVAAPEALTQLNPNNVPIPQLDDDTRAQVAEQLGYRSIGKELPDGITLGQIIKSMPSDVFELNPLRAWGAVVTSIVSMAAALYLISISPWYLLPFAWALAGTAFTGFFVVGHDCGHRSFSKNKLVEVRCICFSSPCPHCLHRYQTHQDIVGTLMFMPLIYPFDPWRIKHNVHHANTNKLIEDTAWHPVMEEHMEGWSPLQKTLYTVFLGSPLKLWASIGHWALWHFDLNKYSEAQKPRVMISLAAVFAFMAIGFPTIIYYTGWVGWAKYWLMPWLGYHFWMSTFTVIHHTAPHIPFRCAKLLQCILL